MDVRWIKRIQVQILTRVWNYNKMDERDDDGDEDDDGDDVDRCTSLLDLSLGEDDRHLANSPSRSLLAVRFSRTMVVVVV